MTGPDAPAPIRLEPYPADGRLALLRLDRPPLNAFDQRMWDLFADVTASLHGDTLYRAVDAALDLPVEDGLALEADLIARCFGSEDGQRGLRSFVDQGPRKATFLGR